jgi:hypothetical protein
MTCPLVSATGANAEFLLLLLKASRSFYTLLSDISTSPSDNPKHHKNGAVQITLFIGTK